MNLYQLVKKIEEIVKDIPNMGTIFQGDIYEANHMQDVKYPAFCTTQREHTENFDEETLTYGLYLFTFDRLMSNESNRLEVQSQSMTILRRVVEALEDEGIIITSCTYHTFNERFNDVCSGAYVDLMLQVDITECE